MLVADGKLRTEGQKRGTRYFAGGGKGPKPKAAKARGPRGGANTKASKPAKRAAQKQAAAAPPTPAPETVQAA